MSKSEAAAQMPGPNGYTKFALRLMFLDNTALAADFYLESTPGYAK
jgi:hypothetical protein